MAPSKKIQTVGTSANNIALLGDKEIRIIQEVYHVNQLTPYPLNSTQLEDWALTINELMPDLDPDVLKKVIDKMKMGVIDWNYRLGIQNIFKALKDELEPGHDFLKRL